MNICETDSAVAIPPGDLLANPFAEYAVRDNAVSQASEPAPANIRIDDAPGNVVEMLLKNQRRLDQLLRTEQGQAELIPRLLAVAVGGLALYGVTATVMLNIARDHSGFWLPGLPAAYWNGSSAASLVIAYSVGLLAACGICLPSFYFYSLLAGVRMSMLAAAAHALKCAAATAVALVGILPLYVAGSLNVLVYSRSALWLTFFTSLVLILPFLAGIWGVVCLNRGFSTLADTIPSEFRGERTCLLRRLILAWSGCFTFVTPLVIYALWQHLSLAAS